MAKHHTEDQDEEDKSLPETEATEDNTSEVDDSDKSEASAASHSEQTDKKALHHHAWHWVLTHKKISIPAFVVLVAALLFAIPTTRYAVLGTFVTQDVEVVVLDSETNQPVSKAAVSFAGVTAQTNAQGKAKLHVKVGQGSLDVGKQYYKAYKQPLTVGLGKPAQVVTTIDANGRPVAVSVANTISGEAVKNVTLTVEKSKVLTDDKGTATIILPPKATTLKGALTADGFNKTEVTVSYDPRNSKPNAFTITPAGKIYFLSNATGKIDMMKSNLDGTERQLVVAGTGKEDKNNTVLFASRDWKNIAFLSKRDGGDYPKLFLVDTTTDALSVIDEGDANFYISGWVGDRLVYQVQRPKVKAWEPKNASIKTFTVATKKLATLVDTNGEGSSSFYSTQNFGGIFLLGDEIAYVRNWYGGGQQATFNTIRVDGTQKKELKAYPQNWLDARSGDFGEVYIRSGDGQHESYQNGKLAASNISDDEYYQEYPYYLLSPSSKQTLWSEFRDGKNTFFVGDQAGEHGQNVGAAEDTFATYGWFTDNYILITRKASELRIMPATGLKAGAEASLKISDYYKPNYNRYSGYGYGG